MRLVLSCEHGGMSVPKAYRALFRGADKTLLSHRGYDPGALALARLMARRLGAPLYAVTVTRLLVETNRSPTHPRVFSTITKALPAAERAAILRRYHAPHRARVAAAVGGGSSPVLHLGVHSFTPVLDGVRRTMDLALLYDPGRRRETCVARDWSRRLRVHLPELSVRANAPYRGVSDGLTTTLRKAHPARHYLGIELEVNQRFFVGPGRAAWPHVRGEIVESLVELLRAW